MRRTVKLFNLPVPKKNVNAIRIRKDCEFDEFSVEFIDFDGKVIKAMTYYTDDKDDALDTAKAELEKLS